MIRNAGFVIADFVKEEQAETEGKTREDQDAWDESEGIFDRAIGPKLPVLPDFTEVALGVMAVGTIATPKFFFDNSRFAVAS